MPQTPDQRDNPLNLDSGWAAATPFPTWASCFQRRGGAPTYKQRCSVRPNAEYGPLRKRAKQQHGPGPWCPAPRWPFWAMYSNWGGWRGPWLPPPTGFRKPPARVPVIWLCGPRCLCCCCCWCGPRKPGWRRTPGRKKRWGRRGRWLRRQPRRSCPMNPPVDLSKLLRPVNLYGWRAPGMRAPRNTTQFIMNQIYEDMRQQEELERQQAAERAQRGGPGHTPPAGGRGDDQELPEALFGFVQEPSLVFSPEPSGDMQSPTAQPGEEEEKGKEEEEEEEKEEEHKRCCEECQECCEKDEESGDEEEEEEDGEVEEMEEEADAGEEEVDYGDDDFMEEAEEEELEEEEEEMEGEEEEEEEQRGEENHLPLEMPLSILVGAEEERENFVNCAYFSPEKMIHKVSQDPFLRVQDINC